MKLVFTPNPDYIHKVLVVAYEAGVLDRLELQRTRPFDEKTSIWDYNPLGKVPSLVLDDGSHLFGGLVICQYLDSLSVTGRSVYPKGEALWPALRQVTLGDGMFDATTLLRVEGWREQKDWHMDYMMRERRKMIGCLDAMEAEAPEFSRTDFHIGHICMAGGLSYLELRNPIQEYAIVDGDADFEWREGRPNLAAWYESILDRPSIAHKVVVPEDA